MSSALQQSLIDGPTRSVEASESMRREEREVCSADMLLAKAETLLSSRGEASGVAMAGDLLRAIESLDASGKTMFFTLLATRFGPDRRRLEHAIEIYRQNGSEEAASDLHEAAEPRRQELIRRLNLAPGGTGHLVGMRTELLDRIPQHPKFSLVDRDFEHLFSSWFNRGFLLLKRIDWGTSAAVLEKLIRYEAVHEIRDWNDLRRRIDPPDRRCYAFFHPALADEPLIFVQVALSRGIPGAIGPIIAADRQPIAPRAADTAVFYSISNCQRGLQGVSFGNFLIKQVVEELARDFPWLETFVTLSPVPAFTSWLRRALKTRSLPLLSTQDRDRLRALDHLDWTSNPDEVAGLEPLLMPLAAHYFLESRTPEGRLADPVARFHLRNGARLERINWFGDTSEKGLAQSAGLMVNYRYRLEDIERNHEAFANHGEVVASAAVMALLDTPPADAQPRPEDQR